jgi:hypothetical protein
MINRGKGMLITGGLIIRRTRSWVCLAKGTVVPTLFKKKPEEKGTALQESGTEAGRN